MCLLAPTVTDKLDKAHLSSRSLFKERESADQYQAPTGVHSTQWVVLSANHYATVISPTCEKSRPCPPERSSSARLMMRWIFDQCQVSMWGLAFFSRRKAVLSQFRLVWWAPLPGYQAGRQTGVSRWTATWTAVLALKSWLSPLWSSWQENEAVIQGPDVSSQDPSIYMWRQAFPSHMKGWKKDVTLFYIT